MPEYKLKTLSPIHIGNGEQINNWAYSIDNNKISIYKFEKVVNSIKNNKQRLINLTAEIERNPLTKNIGDIIKAWKLNIESEYTIEIKGKIKNHRNEYKQIWDFIKEGNEVYIPGTEIKGAIRTALFYKILKDKFNQDKKLKENFLKDYENCLRGENKKEIKKNFERLSKKWENYVFRGDFKENDGKKDFLRFLIVSDTDLKNPEECLEVDDIKLIGASGSFEELHEVLKAGTEFKIKMNIPWKEEYEGFISDNYKYLGLKKLREACNEFAESILETEIEYFKNTSDLNQRDKEIILVKLERRLDLVKVATNKKWLVLRLGKHQGFHSITINLLVKQLNQMLFAKAFKEIAPKGYENKPNKSRKITLTNEILGWLIIDLNS
ncbi:type III-A CRISPR-associated RAMP protein Csm5 [Hydrogenothermus marinus]|uniref:CRISPR system Cms protein Csm5 n=1 Tax=Hydrogenothermus marinus TaxID=133270 RepID=A0A3M0BU88_9AQUI|nr:type III-A CRISPR-associated RAMP protein Csm5 [Hydrogenothermus marinus]RMB00045.1 CRISPR-associated protein Csm5 [Hydrogenothermus marinus]